MVERRADAHPWAAVALLAALLLNYGAWAFGVTAGLATPALVLALAVVGCVIAWPGRRYGASAATRLFLAALLVVTLGTATDTWDARSIWMFHGKRIYLDGSLYAQLDGYFGLSHNDYPVLVPALAASVAGLLGGWNEVAPKLASMLAWVPAMLVILALLRHAQARLGFLAAVLLIDGAGLVDGMVDMPLALNVTACAAAMQWLLTRTAAGDPEALGADDSGAVGTWLAVPPLLLATMSLLKNEGLALAVLLTLGFLVLAAQQRSLRALRWSLAGCLASFGFILAWTVACQRSGIIVDLGPGALPRLLARLPDLSAHLLIAGALLASKPLLACALVAGWGLRDSGTPARLFRLPLALAGMYLGLLYLVYLSTPNDLAWHLGSSAARILHTVELLLLYVGLAALSARPAAAAGGGRRHAAGA